MPRRARGHADATIWELALASVARAVRLTARAAVAHGARAVSARSYRPWRRGGSPAPWARVRTSSVARGSRTCAARRSLRYDARSRTGRCCVDYVARQGVRRLRELRYEHEACEAGE